MLSYGNRDAETGWVWERIASLNRRAIGSARKQSVRVEMEI
jgi:hypothetical protein